MEGPHGSFRDLVQEVVAAAELFGGHRAPLRAGEGAEGDPRREGLAHRGVGAIVGGQGSSGKHLVRDVPTRGRGAGGGEA